MRRAAGIHGTAVALLVVATGAVTACALAPPTLVRDDAGLFSAESEAEAEGRLRQAAAETGIWAFVLTSATAEPPQMLRDPMEVADEVDARAVAMMLNLRGVVGVGYSEASGELQDQMTFSPPDVSGLLADGRGDDALVMLVDYAVAWSMAPPTVGPVPDVELEGPTPAGP